MAEIQVEALNRDEFRVRVVEGGSRTTHRVTIDSKDQDRFGSGTGPEQLLEESFRFLLEREPKESILQAFKLSVIERYFPEYPDEIRRRLAKD